MLENRGQRNEMQNADVQTKRIFSHSSNIYHICYQTYFLVVLIAHQTLNVHWSVEYTLLVFLPMYILSRLLQKISDETMLYVCSFSFFRILYTIDPWK